MKTKTTHSQENAAFCGMTNNLFKGFSDLTDSEQEEHLSTNKFVSHPFWTKVKTDAQFEAIINLAKANDGCTFCAVLNLANDTLYSTPISNDMGYYVSLQGFEKVLPKGVELTPQEVLKYIINVNKHLAEGTYIGLWKNSGRWYLDVTVHCINYKDAVQMGYAHNQFSIWDCANNVDIKLDKNNQLAEIA